MIYVDVNGISCAIPGWAGGHCLCDGSEHSLPMMSVGSVVKVIDVVLPDVLVC